MKRIALLIISIIIISFVFVASSREYGKLIILKVYIFNRPPLYVVKNNKFSGTLVEKTKKILDKAMLSYKFINMPPARILHELQRESNACSIGWFNTARREKKFIYSKPIYSESNYFLIAVRAGFSHDSKEVLNSPRNTIALIKGFSYGENIDKLLSKSKIKKFYVLKPDAEKLLLMVKNKRVDATIISKEEADYLFKKDDFSEELDLLEFKEKFTIKRYLIFSRKTDKQIIEKINQAIEKLK